MKIKTKNNLLLYITLIALTCISSLGFLLSMDSGKIKVSAGATGGDVAYDSTIQTSYKYKLTIRNNINSDTYTVNAVYSFRLSEITSVYFSYDEINAIYESLRYEGYYSYIGMSGIATSMRYLETASQAGHDLTRVFRSRTDDGVTSHYLTLNFGAYPVDEILTARPELTNSISTRYESGGKGYYKIKAGNNVNTNVLEITAEEVFDIDGEGTFVKISRNTLYTCPFYISGYDFINDISTNLTLNRDTLGSTDRYYYCPVEMFSTIYLIYNLYMPNELFTVTFLYQNELNKLSEYTLTNIGYNTPLPSYYIHHFYGLRVASYTLTEGTWDAAETTLTSIANIRVLSDLTIQCNYEPDPNTSNGTLSKCKVYVYLGTTKIWFLKAKIYAELEISFFDTLPSIVAAKKFLSKDNPTVRTNYIGVYIGDIPLYGITLSETNYAANITSAERQDIDAMKKYKLSDFDWTNHESKLKDLQDGKPVILYGVMDYMLLSDNPYYNEKQEDLGMAETLGKEIGNFFNALIANAFSGTGNTLITLGIIGVIILILLYLINSGKGRKRR